MPIQLKSWLLTMARRAEYLEKMGVKSDGSVYAPENWNPIEPLCKTTWNQDAPYNKETPVINGTQSPTGCVATSFAQAMYYFKYPDRGKGTVSYINNGKTLRLNLGSKALKWNDMLDSYTGNNYTDAQVDAVAYLMKACGYSVQMGYTQYSSGAQSYRLINAMVNNFGYDSGATYEDRQYYSTADWTELIYNNIKNVGPVIYDGAAMEGGHSFICDGYSGDGYFHFNWGWGGLSDGYYVLDVLNPESQGTGGAVGGFNYGQNAVIGMQKPTGVETTHYVRMMQYGNTAASLGAGNLIDWYVNDYDQLGWAPGNFRNGVVALGGKIENVADGSLVQIAQGGMGSLGQNATLSVGYWVPQTNSHPVIQLPSGLADGTYKITLVCKDTSADDAPWESVLIAYGYCNYTLLNVQNGTYTLANQSPKTLRFEDMSFVNDLYYGKNTMMKGKVVNNTDLDLTVCIQPILTSNGKRQFAGDMMLVSASPNQTVENEWIVTFYPLENSDPFQTGNKYTLQIIDKSSGQVLGTFGEVTMSSVSGNLSIKVKEFNVDGCTKEDVTVGTRTFKNTYVIGDVQNPFINFDFDVTSGYFDGALQIGMQWFNPEKAAYERVEGDLISYHPFLANGQGAELDIPLDMASLKNTGVYNVIASAVTGGRASRLGSMNFALRNTGVNSIVDADAEAPVYFNLQGIQVKEPVKGQVLIMKKGDKIEKVVIK